MNRIYRLVKNRFTGAFQAVSEIAKSGKKCGGIKLASIIIASTLSGPALADIGIPQNYDPSINDSKVGSQQVSGNTTIDLGIGQGFNSATKGNEVKQHAITSGDSISTLYQQKYKDVQDAQTNYNKIQADFNAGNASQLDLDNALNTLNNKKAIADTISDDKFKITDTDNLIGKNSEGITIGEKQIKYRDLVTGKTFELKVKGDLEKTSAQQIVAGGGVSVNFYEKTPDDNQYSDMEMIVINGSGSQVTVDNTGASDNKNLSAISKDNSGVIKVNDGANLTFATDVSYYTGTGKSTSVAFKEQDDYGSTSTKTLYNVTFKGKINTILGERTINNENDFNQFNKELIEYIQDNEQIRLDYPTADKLQAFYDSQINNLYGSQVVGSFDVTYSLEKDELEELAEKQGLGDEFKNKVTKDDVNDIGLKTTSNNYFVGVTGSGSVIKINSGVTVNNSTDSANISSGTVIKANFTQSGQTAKNQFQIDGTINANAGEAIAAKNADINLSQTGYINGNILLTGNGDSSGKNTVTNNGGAITGTISTENADIVNQNGGSIGSVSSGGGSGGNSVKVTNDASSEIGAISLGKDANLTNQGNIKGSITASDGLIVTNDGNVGGSVTGGNNSNISNLGQVSGSVSGTAGSTIYNDLTGVIGGVAIVSGSGATFQNDGKVGGISASHGAVAVNNINKEIINAGSNAVSVGDNSTVNNLGDIYIGYQDVENSDGTITRKESGNSGKYTGIIVNGTGGTFNNGQNIFIASTQSNVVGVQVIKGQYIDNANSKIIFNKDNNTITGLDKDIGNNNTGFLVAGEGSNATINGTIELNDSGSTGLAIKNKGDIKLNGTVNVNNKGVTSASGVESSIVSFGAWIEGLGSKLTLTNNGQINLNAERGIGVHVRDGGAVEIKDTAGITFGNQKNQIGFLISGIKDPASIIYSSSKNIALNGEGSVLFRVERGSTFSSNTVQGQKLSELNSNGTKNSTLIQITNGLTATGTSNQTTANLEGFTLNVDGENAKGISVEGGATASIYGEQYDDTGTLISSGTTINLTGDNSILARVDGWYYDLNGIHQSNQDGKSKLTSSANLKSGGNVTGQNSVGYYLTHGGQLDHTGTIDFDLPSQNNIGVKIDSGGLLNSKTGSFIKVNGTAVEISGSTSQAVIQNDANGTDPVIWAIGGVGNTNDSAYHVKDSANLKLTGSGITKAEGTAHGILVDGASNIALDGAFLDLYGDGTSSSSGNGIENRSSLQNIRFTNNARIDVKDGIGIHSSIGFSQASKTSGVINVYGSGSGIRFEGINPTDGTITGSTNNAINNTGYENVVVNVYENTGHGIYVDSTKDVITSTSVNILSNAGQSALEIKGTTEKASQSGKLHSANQNNVIVDLNNGHLNNFTNSGDILFGSFDSTNNNQFTAADKADLQDKKAIATSSSENALNFTNAAKGNINGLVELLGYGDAIDPTDKTKGNIVTLIGSGNVFKTGQGNDEFFVEKVVGDDLGGADQVKQFTQLDGGEGDDQITFKNQSDFTITKDSTIKNIEYFALDGNSKVTLDNLIASVDGLNTGTTHYDIIDKGSILNYIWNGSNTHFDRQLTGNGVLNVNLNNNDFAFKQNPNAGKTSFKGTLELTDTTYQLQDSSDHSNTSMLEDATLKASDDSYVKVGNGDQNIKGLYFNGGTIDFGKIDIKNTVSDNHITVDTLTLEKGTVQVDVTGPIYNAGVPSSLPLLEQDNGIKFTQLVAANNITGGAANLDIDRSKISLVDKDGNPITDAIKTALVQNGEEVARATYDVRLSKYKDYNTNQSQDDGLYLGYGLTQVELKVKNDNGNALILDATNSKAADPDSSELDAIVTDYDNGDGTYSYGDLQIRGTKNVTLAAQNSYHGSTYVKDTATLTAGNHNALGNTRLLQLDSNTAFDLNGKTQSIGSLVTNTNSKVDLNNGKLTITGIDGTNGDTDLVSNVQGNTLFGAGDLVIGDSSLTRALPASPVFNIYGDNLGLSAKVTNAVNTTINQFTYGGLGTGDLINNGTYNLDLSTDNSLSNSSVTGNGILNKYNIGILDFSLAQVANYQGKININGGAVRFTGDGNSDFSLPSSGKYNASDINIGLGTDLIAKNYVHFAGNVSNAGNFYVGHELTDSTPTAAADYKTVKIDGNYVGDSGNLFFNGILGDDSSPINKLIISGDSSGTGIVVVNNIGGLGAKTVNGISIIDVGGQSDAEFSQANRIIAGAYEYKLQRSATNTNNWVLFSELTARPEIGSYIGNLFSANNLFNLRLHDRVGETQYTDLLTGESKITSMWMRHQYGYNKFNAANGDLSVRDNWNITQLGGDIAQWSSNELNRLHLGLMVGYGRSKTTSKSNIDRSKSDGTVDGYSYGVYATWYDNNQDKTGLYVDTWALWNDFDASASGKEFSEKYKLKGLTASIESGYSFEVGTLGNYDVWLQPKAQATYGNVKADDFTEKNGARVSFNSGNLQTRLGLKGFLLSNQEMMAKTNQSAQLFLEANWLHNTKLYDVTVNNETTIKQDGARNIGELKVGLEGNILKNTNIWFNLAGQKGDHDYENASIMLGAKYSF